MSQVQVPLQFYQQTKQTFGAFLGNESAVESLEHYHQLPQFTYLWGEKFTGKSHLLAALEEALQNQKLTYLFLDTNMIKDFDVVNNLPAEVGYILLDDVDQLQSDADGELALFNMYNWCRSKECKLILAANSSPRSKLWQLPDLQSRLNSGLVLALTPLKGEVALQCIEQQFSTQGIPLEPSVVNYLTATQNTSYQYLYPLFLQISAESLALKRKVTVPLVKKAIQSNQISVS